MKPIPSTFVIIRTHCSDAAIRFVFDEDERGEFARTLKEPDPLISRLQHLPWIDDDASSWIDLNRGQIQLLLAISLTIMFETDRSEVAVVGVRRAILALLALIEGTSGWISQLKIDHKGSLEIEVEVAMTLGVKYETAQPTNNIRVIVDNTTD